MGKVQRDCWRCDLCGYDWLIVDEVNPPRQCPKCRKTNWHKVAGSLPADVGREKPNETRIKSAKSLQSRRGSPTEKIVSMAQRAVEAEEPARPKLNVDESWRKKTPILYRRFVERFQREPDDELEFDRLSKYV